MLSLLEQRRNRAILQALKDHNTRISASPEAARAYLIGTGIYNTDGSLAPEFGGPTKEQRLLSQLSSEWVRLGVLHLEGGTRIWIKAAQNLRVAGFAESRLFYSDALSWRITAQGIEARSGETGTGSTEGESPVGNADAPDTGGTGSDKAEGRG